MLFHFPKNKKKIAHRTRGADFPTELPPFAPFPDISCPWLWVPDASCPHGVSVLLKSALPTFQLTKPHKCIYLINKDKIWIITRIITKSSALFRITPLWKCIFFSHHAPHKSLCAMRTLLAAEYTWAMTEIFSKCQRASIKKNPTQFCLVKTGRLHKPSTYICRKVNTRFFNTLRNTRTNK